MHGMITQIIKRQHLPTKSIMVFLILIALLAEMIRTVNLLDDITQLITMPEANTTTNNIDDTRITARQLREIINFFAPANPGLALLLNQRDPQAMADLLVATPCLNIDLDVCVVANFQLSFMLIPLKKIHIYATPSLNPNDVLITTQLNNALSSMFDLNVHTLLISSPLEIVPFYHSVDARNPIYVQNLEFDSVSSDVLSLVLSKFSFWISLNLTITNCLIEDLVCMNALMTVFSDSKTNTISLSLINLPFLQYFNPGCFDNFLTIEYLVLRQIGAGAFSLEENEMATVINFLVVPPLVSLTLPMSIFKLIWESPDPTHFQRLRPKTLIIEEIENREIDLILWPDRIDSLWNACTTELVLTFSQEIGLTTENFEDLLKWAGSRFTHIKKVFVNTANWKALLPQVEAKVGWDFSMDLLEELKLGGQDAVLTFTWEHKAGLATQPELTRAHVPEAANCIYILPVSEYGNWANGTIVPRLTQTAATILPRNETGDTSSFTCSICYTGEEEWVVENKAPAICQTICQHALCFECLATLLVVSPVDGDGVALPAVECPTCRGNITPTIVAALVQNTPNQMCLVGVEIDRHLLQNYLVKKYLSIRFVPPVIPAPALGWFWTMVNKIKHFASAWFFWLMRW
ncbi:hypothetical protein NEDG_02171 [Nematocida displodere]|uniref:RING-type domain-containing protein n=1 Tax=Nematocida displodere TaxID=1805483 RepID=A0A177ENK9_9MICR|nr:hypothetical protein NEDG_02171 [Nematocida displodere]